MLQFDEVMAIFKEAGVLQEGHFLLTSGRHSAQYLQCAKVFQNTKYSEVVCADLAEKFKDYGITVVIGPAMGAVQMAYEVSRHLNVPNFFTERVDGQMVLRRGFTLSPEDKVLIVEDVVTTGGSVKEVIEIVLASGAAVAGVGSIVDRTGGEMDFGFPFQSVVSMKVVSYTEEECPLCKEQIPVVKPGSRTIKK